MPVSLEEAWEIARTIDDAANTAADRSFKVATSGHGPVSPVAEVEGSKAPSSHTDCECAASGAHSPDAPSTSTSKGTR